MSYAPRDIEVSGVVAQPGSVEALKVAGTLRQLSAFHLSHGTYNIAERLTRIALWLDPENASGWRLRANCLARMNKPRDALKLLSKARSEGVQGIGLRDLAAIGFAFARSGHIAEAKKFLNFQK